MNQIRKLAAGFLSFAMLISATGCADSGGSDKNGSNAQQSGTTVTTTTEITTTTIFAMSWPYMSMACFLQDVLIVDWKIFLLLALIL